ncbi:ABC transporter ATP-binding protein [Candidatus Gottesmanbacteria bacterium]|nr:ABC transporter ATP-binding protein [Candidatus Gottesmanbacteria bacterium]
MKRKPVIQLTHVAKCYLLHHEKPTLVEKLVKGRDEVFWALGDISLAIEQGESVGIVGANGSGKTTLLKIIAGIATPSRGHVAVDGTIVSLIDLAAGFHPELSGEQNIYLNGMILGMTRQSIAKKILSIIRFADIGQFIDAPLYTYSDGMKLRLGFAIAIAAEPDILILDEGISIGDINFQLKSQQYLRSFRRAGKTLLVVEHRLNYIRQYCTRILLMEQGNIIADGDTSLLDVYRKNSLVKKHPSYGRAR